MQQVQSLNSLNARLRMLALAFFVPVYYSRDKLALNTNMVSTYASVYLKRCAVSALLAFTAGELFYFMEYPLPGTLLTGMFVMFTGLCSVYLAAILEKRRNHS